MLRGYTVVVDNEWFYAGDILGGNIHTVSREVQDIKTLPTAEDARRVASEMQEATPCYVTVDGDKVQTSDLEENSDEADWQKRRRRMLYVRHVL